MPWMLKILDDTPLGMIGRKLELSLFFLDTTRGLRIIIKDINPLAPTILSPPF